eukprot:8589088-Lingulodinium_polyedra.AAC.1
MTHVPHGDEGLKRVLASLRPYTSTGGNQVGHLVPPGAINTEQDPRLVSARRGVVEGGRSGVHNALDE